LSIIKNINIKLLLIIFAISLTGCARKDKKVLHNFNTRTFDYSAEKEEVCVRIKKLSVLEFKTIFNSPNFVKKHFLSKRYQVLQLCFDNISKHNYILNNKSLGIKTVPTDKLFSNFKSRINLMSFLSIPFSTLALAFKIGVAGFAASILAFITNHDKAYGKVSEYAFTYCIPIALTISLARSVTLNQQNTYKNNYTKLFLNTQVLDLKEEKIIPSLTEFKKIIFINKRDLKPNFDITLFEQDSNNRLVFNVPG